jgi:hypothetical protein
MPACTFIMQVACAIMSAFLACRNGSALSAACAILAAFVAGLMVPAAARSIGFQVRE